MGPIGSVEYQKIKKKFILAKNEYPDNLKVSMYAHLLNEVDTYKRNFGDDGDIERLRRNIRFELDVLIGNF